MITRFKPYFSLLKPVKWQFIGAIVAGIIAGSSGFTLPVMMDDVFPMIFVNQQTGTTAEAPEWLLSMFGSLGINVIEKDSLVLWSCMLMPIIFLIRGVFGYINTYLINAAGLQVLEQIRLKAFARLQQLPLAFHQKHKEGDLLTRVMSDTSQIQTALTKIACDLVVQPATLLWALSALLMLAVREPGVRAISVALICVPLCVFPIRMLGKKMYKKARSLQKKSGDMTSVLNQNLASQREIRAYNMEDAQIAHFERDSSMLRRFRLKVVKYRQMVSPSVEIISAVGIAFAIYIGAEEGLSLEVFMAFITAMFFAYDPIKKLGAVSSYLKQAEASLDRVEHILNAEDNIPELKKPFSLGTVTGEVAFEAVQFSYDGNADLTDINLKVPAGQVVALVGPSGAGKSTFVSLIPRFYEVVGGALKVDGIDVRDVGKRELRDNIALVSQHPLLFSGTIAENILIGRPGASKEEMVAAAVHSNAHDFIMSFPDGYETVVGERGEGLSGGQRQRVAIARAFLKNAPILILDEATSALDTESESQIQEALKELSKGRTTFLIAHRFSSIRDAERILVFDKTEKGGQIVADGTHEELYQSCALYKDLYDKQSG
ncbi:ABC transporter ATP-binding protein [Rubritalea spongiae]|uniref:ABC transporter ATP-binding protein n=1 Tax=Rubritalea spongiae TaxID=430797 RepID=A0ABW5E6K1_9BACT